MCLYSVTTNDCIETDIVRVVHFRLLLKMILNMLCGVLRVGAMLWILRAGGHIKGLWSLLMCVHVCT